MTDVATYTVEDGIAWVKFNRPEKRNAMSPTLNRRMMEILDELEVPRRRRRARADRRGHRLTAGMDLKEYFRETEAHGLKGVRQSQRESYGWWRRLRWYQKPTIAMVNGWCFSAAATARSSLRDLAFDLAFAADEAKFGLSEINWGILPGGGATKVAVELLPFRKAMYHALLGEPIDGKTAADWGPRQREPAARRAC